jgi:hypothetical protein
MPHAHGRPQSAPQEKSEQTAAPRATVSPGHNAQSRLNVEHQRTYDSLTDYMHFHVSEDSANSTEGSDATSEDGVIDPFDDDEPRTPPRATHINGTSGATRTTMDERPESAKSLSFLSPALSPAAALAARRALHPRAYGNQRMSDRESADVRKKLINEAKEKEESAARIRSWVGWGFLLLGLAVAVVCFYIIPRVLKDKIHLNEDELYLGGGVGGGLLLFIGFLVCSCCSCSDITPVPLY